MALGGGLDAICVTLVEHLPCGMKILPSGPMRKNEWLVLSELVGVGDVQSTT